MTDIITLLVDALGSEQVSLGADVADRSTSYWRPEPTSTLALLRPVERPLVKGILINRFRGRRELFDEGRTWLEDNTGVPVLGVMPWLNELFPPEDSLDLLERQPTRGPTDLEIVVLKLPSLSNFSDLDPLEAEPTVQLRWVAPGEELGLPDAVVIPGSKQTLRDLAAIHSSGLGAALQAYSAGGGHVFGICGGMQMLGEELCDPEGLEGGAPSVNNSHTGLGLLPLRTVFSADKALRQRSSMARWPAGSSALKLEGFELHHGRTASKESEPCQPLCLDAELGWVTPISERGGFVAGTYLHGVFESGPWRRRWLNQLRARKGLPPLSEQQPHHSRQREALLDRLADAFEQPINIEPLLSSSPQA